MFSLTGCNKFFVEWRNGIIRNDVNMQFAMSSMSWMLPFTIKQTIRTSSRLENIFTMDRIMDRNFWRKGKYFNDIKMIRQTRRYNSIAAFASTTSYEPKVCNNIAASVWNLMSAIAFMESNLNSLNSNNLMFPIVFTQW